MRWSIRMHDSMYSTYLNQRGRVRMCIDEDGCWHANAAEPGTDSGVQPALPVLRSIRTHKHTHTQTYSHTHSNIHPPTHTVTSSHTDRCHRWAQRCGTVIRTRTSSRSAYDVDVVGDANASTDGLERAMCRRSACD